MSWHALRQLQIGWLCMVTWELESQLWTAEFLQLAGIEQGGQRL